MIFDLRIFFFHKMYDAEIKEVERIKKFQMKK